MVVGDVRQYFAAAVSSGAAFHRFSTEFPDTAAQKDVLHPHRVHMTISSIDEIPIRTYYPWTFRRKNYCKEDYRNFSVEG